MPIRNRKEKLKKKRVRRLKQGKPVYFTLANSPRKYRGFSNKYAYKTNIHNLIYKNAKLENVNFKASILTECNFRKAKITGVDFIFTNLKKTDFRNANFSNVIFFGANLENVNFESAKFHNTYFICTNLKKVKNLDTSSAGITILNEYPKLSLNSVTMENLMRLSQINKIYKYRVIHVSKNKINNWIIYILLSMYGEHSLSKAFNALVNRKNKNRFYTFYSYNRFISDYLKDYKNI